MSGKKGMKWVGCGLYKGLTSQEWWKLCEKQYSGFGKWRHEIGGHGLPDYGVCLFNKRQFNIDHFELERND